MRWMNRRRGESRPRGRPRHPDVLTPAEWRVLEEVRAGRPNVEIAERLGVSQNTVKTQISSMLAKLDLPDRHALAEWDGEPQEVSRQALGRGLALPAWLSGGSLAGGAKVTGAVAGAGLLLAAIVVAFSALDDGADATSGDATPADGPAFVELLRYLPDDPEVRHAVFLGDLERARAVAEIDAPDGTFSQDALVAYLDALPSAASQRFDFLAGPGSTAHLGTFGELASEHLGVSPLDVDQWATASLGEGARNLGVVRAAVTAGNIAERLGACTECPPVDEADHAGWRTYAWGDEPSSAEEARDPDRRFEPPLHDAHGRPGRLAVTDGVLMRAILMDDLQEMIDASAGHASLADDDGFRRAAAGMDGLGAITAHLADILDAGVVLAGVEPADDRLLPFEVVATGLGAGGDGTYAAIVLVHTDEAAAAENADRLPARVAAAQAELEALHTDLDMPPPDAWGEAVDDLDITTEGAVVLATLRLDTPSDADVTSAPHLDPEFEQYLITLLAHE